MSSALRKALAVSSLGAAMALGAAGSASAAHVAGLPDGLSQPDVDQAAATGNQGGTFTALPAAANPLTSLPVNPLAGTGVDPLSNSVGTSIEDGPAVSTAAVTNQLSQGASLDDVLRGVR
jgi:hypothetical protein